MPLQGPDTDASDYDDRFVTEEEVSAFVPTVLSWVVERVNQLVGEKWANPVDQVPVEVKNVALDVAVRALGNPQGVDSRTRSTDGTAVTDRFTTRANIERRIYLTPGELAILRGPSRRRKYGTVMVGVR